MLRRLPFLLLGLVIAAALILGGMIWLGGPPRPPVNQHLAARDNDIDAGLSDLPPMQAFAARDGAKLAYRRYPGTPGQGLAVLVHGSSGSGAAVHALAKALSATGVTAIAIDVRGHGANRPHGDITYADQLDDDMADLARELDKSDGAERRLLVGHSSGGGFTLRIAGGERACEFDGYVALSPYLNYQATTNRPDGGWSGAGMPRIIAINILGRFGIGAFDGLPVVNFAIKPGETNRTYSYSWRLLSAFGLPQTHWEDRVRAITQPTAILIGANDDLFFADRMSGVISAINPKIPVEVVPGVDHMGMVLAPAALSEDVEEIRRLLSATPAKPRC
jgi:non-heme chloroperoxidase